MPDSLHGDENKRIQKEIDSLQGQLSTNRSVQNQSTYNINVDANPKDKPAFESAMKGTVDAIEEKQRQQNRLSYAI